VFAPQLLNWRPYPLRRLVDSQELADRRPRSTSERVDCPTTRRFWLRCCRGLRYLIFCNSESRAFVGSALERPLAVLVAALVTTLSAEVAPSPDRLWAY